MLTHRRSVAILCAVVCALAFAAPAVADFHPAAQAQYYASFRHEAPIGADPQALYYASFRHETPIAAPHSTSGGPSWLIPAIVFGLAVLVVAGGAAQARRVRLRERTRVAA